MNCYSVMEALMLKKCRNMINGTGDKFVNTVIQFEHILFNLVGLIQSLFPKVACILFCF